jgi:hypothetical protein
VAEFEKKDFMPKTFVSKTRSQHAMINKPPYTLQSLCGEHIFALSTMAQREYNTFHSLGNFNGCL